ncbi:hypothetical protein [Acidiplasma sp.]|uniref:hypothetical protein n=1 Tax=Acidiplasma sp. TaxID=1872114 RepID=UPI002588EF10|nr:hypothetical protein [Acidiplasma sp.]
MYYLIKYGYDGKKFCGFQRNNGENSVENTIINVLKSHNISDNMESAARTDKYVSAAGNVFLIESKIDIIKILKILNSQIKDMYFYQYAGLSEYFNPRYCTLKKYSYVLDGDYDIEKFMVMLRKFEGTHDFKNFSRKDYRNTVRTIKNIDYYQHNGFFIINFYARSFIWHQIRAIMGFAMRYYEMDLDPFAFKINSVFLASPERLILMDIFYENITFSDFNSSYLDGKITKKLTDINVNRVIYSRILYKFQ